jgi:hypothetical protein
MRSLFLSPQQTHHRGPITRFFHEHRPNMTVPYVLITSKTDGETPIQYFSNRLDNDPLLQAWYGINPSYATGAHHPKYRMMPLGLTGNKYRQHPDLDLLMKARNYTNPFGGDKSRWTNLTTWLQAKDTTPLLFVKFGMHENALHRDVPFNMACANRTMEPLDDISCNLQKGANPRQTYTAASKYLFGLSPPGNGLDCFRTYEYLLNGVIPVVLRQPEYNELFVDLPVLQLRHWNYTQKQLVKKMKNFVFSSEFLDNTFDAGWERLFLQYWRHKVLKDAGRLDQIITDPQGNEYFKAWQYTLYRPPLIQHATPAHQKVIKQREEEKERERIQQELLAKSSEAKEGEKKPAAEQDKMLTATQPPPAVLTASATGQASRLMGNMEDLDPEGERKANGWKVEDHKPHNEKAWNDVGMARVDVEEARQLQRKLQKEKTIKRGQRH